MAGTKIGTAGVTFPDASVQASKAAKGKLWVMATLLLSNSTVSFEGNFAAVGLDAVGEYCYFSDCMPSDFTTLTKAVIVFIMAQTGGQTFDWTVTTDFCTSGEASTTHSDTATADGNATANTIQSELDISAAFTGILANDC